MPLSDLTSQIARFNSYFDSGATHSAYALFPDLATSFLRQLYPISPAGTPKDMFLVHYTSLETIFSMLDPKNPECLRLYDTIHANDPTEGTFFRHTLQRTAPSLASQLPPLVLESRPGHAYITSFVRADKLAVADKLVYWLAYGSNGYGCSIALPSRTFIPNLPVLPVQYGKARVRRIAHQILSFLSALTPKFRNKLGSDTAPDSASSALNMLRSIPYFHKPGSYRHEKECRVLLSPLDRHHAPIYELRHSLSGAPVVRHYVEHDRLRLSGVLYTGTAITLGPSIPKPKNVQRAIQSLLRHHKLSGPTVSCSNIPYTPPST